MSFPATDESIQAWGAIEYPTLATDTYDLYTSGYYSIYGGVFGYDLTEWEETDPDYFSEYIEGYYDGWSIGFIMYFEDYQFTDDSQSFGACLENGHCFGVWLEYETSGSLYTA